MKEMVNIIDAIKEYCETKDIDFNIVKACFNIEEATQQMDEVVENKRDFFEVKYKTNTGLDYTFTFNNPKNTMSEMKKFCSCFGGISISNLNNTEINYQLLIRNNFLIIKYQDSIIDYDSIPYDECLSILLDLFARVFAVSKQNAGLVDYQKKKNNI